MLNRVPPCRCKRPRDTKRFIQAVPLKSSCALWTFIAAHDRCVHTNGSAIAAHNSPIMLRHCWHLLLENLRAFPIWDLQRFDFTFVGRSLCHLRGIRGMVPPMDDSPVRAVRTLPQLPTTLIDLRTAGSSCIYIYISLTYLGTFLSEALNSQLHHCTKLVLSAISPSSWHKIGEVFPLRCLFLMRHPPADDEFVRKLPLSAFKLLDVGWPWMT